MKVLGIYGSPRKGGNSDLLLDALLEAAKEAGAETRAVYARDLSISGCRECGGCDKTGKCVVKDDMQDLYPVLREADAIVTSGPIFFYNFPAQLKALIDRTQAMWSDRLLKKGQGPSVPYESGTGYAIGVGATRGKNLFEGCELTCKYFYDAMDMEYGGGIFFRRVEEKGAILKHEDAMAQARALGRKIVLGE